MDKRVIFAVAGSGKTTYIISHLNTLNRFLLITYTNNNLINIRTKIIQKFGYIPNNIILYSYFSFLYTFCYKPIISQSIPSKGITYQLPNNHYTKKTEISHYRNKEDKLYSNRISKLIIAKNFINPVCTRIEKYFDYLFIDEIQDFGGNDFNLIKEISKINLNIIYVGDFFQHTFDTSRDGNINSSLHNNYKTYANQFVQMGVMVDITTLSKSYRCSPTICNFISNMLGISIESHRSDETKISLIDNKLEIANIMNDNKIIKLFYNQHYIYNCKSKNWGESKGEDTYNDVCVVLNNTTLKLYNQDNLISMKASSKNKLYVALTRARNHLYLIGAENLKFLVNDNTEDSN